jgi:hypothetical protein
MACSANQCVVNQNKNGDRLFYIRHPGLGIAHIFHDKCLMLLLSQDPEFLRTGTLSACPVCYKTMNAPDLPYPNPKEVAKIGFIYFMQTRNWKAALKVWKDGPTLLDQNVLKWAMTHSEFVDHLRTILEQDRQNEWRLPDDLRLFLASVRKSIREYQKERNSSSSLSDLQLNVQDVVHGKVTKAYLMRALSHIGEDSFNS